MNRPVNMSEAVDFGRIRTLRDGEPGTGPVVYWMSRDQRAYDNWALLFAQQLALRRQAPLGVAFTLSPSFLGATIRHYAFMLRGLAETETLLCSLNIPLFLLRGSPPDQIIRFVAEKKVCELVTDFDPLRIKQSWKDRVAEAIPIPFHEVDAHNVVPCRAASDHQEHAARTIRPKLMRLLPRFLVPFPERSPHPVPWPSPPPPVEWERIEKELAVDRTVCPVSTLPGSSAGMDRLARFIREGLPDYPNRRNDPLADGQSGLSPWLHFGQISPQRVALEVMGSSAPQHAKDAFLEELIVRRELSDNYCLYNTDYDRFGGLPAWGRRTLEVHRSDPRPYIYDRRQLEWGETHDPLWNAAQLQMVHEGTMPGYLRMYWGKKILEWSRSQEEAMETAIHLNDRYQLDGRDPNGYAGIAWCIGGLHDRPWKERPIFGSIRYMTLEGCMRKFDAARYVEETRCRWCMPAGHAGM